MLSRSMSRFIFSDVYEAVAFLKDAERPVTDFIVSSEVMVTGVPTFLTSLIWLDLHSPKECCSAYDLANPLTLRSNWRASIDGCH